MRCPPPPSPHPLIYAWPRLIQRVVKSTFQDLDFSISVELFDNPSVDTVVKTNNKDNGENDDRENAVFKK